MFFSDMERKTLAITPPSFSSFHLRGVAFGSSKAFHCLLLLSCLLLSSVTTLHNLAEFASFGSNGYNPGSTAKVIQGFYSEDYVTVSIQKSDQIVCPSSQLLCSLSAFGSENQSLPFLPFFGVYCPKESPSSSALVRKNLSRVVWLSLKPVLIIKFQPFAGFFHIEDTTCYKPLSKELYDPDLGKHCGGNSYMVNHQCEGYSLEPGESIKFLFFYQTDLSWAGIAFFAVPMKTTTPVLMLNLCKKPVFWIRTKKFLIAVLVAVVLLILILCFNDHFIEENIKENNCNHMELTEVEKPPTIMISTEMDSLLRSIYTENLQGFDKNPQSSSIKAVASVSSIHEEASEALNLTIKTGRDKKRRRNKKKKRGTSGLTPEGTDVSSSHSANSTPSTPMSPEPPTTVGMMKPVKPPKPVLSHSATFPVSGVKSMIIQRSSLAPNVRAPGPKSRMKVQEEKVKEYRYDIWGDHLTGLHLMDRFKDAKEGKSSRFDGDECESFFDNSPQKLLADAHTCHFLQPMELIKK